jgi:hypothetical protein
MTKEIKGTKIKPEEEKKLDPAKMGVMLMGNPKEAEVEGQEMIYCRTQCPWCLNWGRSVCSTNVYLWYTCGSCGGRFRA